MLFLEYSASFAVDCKFAPEFESCYIFAQIENRDSLHGYGTFSGLNMLSIIKQNTLGY